MSALLLLLALAAEPAPEPAPETAPTFTNTVDDFPRAARETADVQPKGRWSTGLFNATRVAFADGFELEANPIWFFVAPNLLARVALLEGRTRVTLEGGLMMPTLAMRLLKGYFFPTWGTSTQNPGWMLLPQLGLLLTTRVREHDAFTLRAHFTGRLAFTENEAVPLESFIAPLNLLFAAATTGSCTRVGAGYDLAVGQRLRVRGELNLYVTGPTPHLVAEGVDRGPLKALSPLYVTGHLGIDIAVFKHSRIALGVLWANYDQGKTEVHTNAEGFAERSPARSNNFLPTLDYIWAGGFGD